MDNEEAANVVRLPTNAYAIAGLYGMDDLQERPPPEIWQTGFFDWTGKVYLGAGMVSAVTGLPSSGKTHLWVQIWNYIIGRYQFGMMVAPFECMPKPHYRRYVREIMAQTRERDISPEMLTRTDKFIREHYQFVIHPKETPTLDWFLDMAEIAVAKRGCRVVQLDPWNRMESQRGPRESEPEYIARCLRTCSVFAKDMNCHVQIVAHPAKRDGKRRDQPPELEDISGAMHWWNMIDQGFVSHRETLWTKEGGQCVDATFYYRKAKFEELGHPCAMPISYNPKTRVFEARDLSLAERNA